MRNGQAARVGGDTATMGERCGWRRQLVGAAMALTIGLAVVVGVNHPWISLYGIDSRGFVAAPTAGGVAAFGIGNQACVGVEFGGDAPGFFGSFTDASACDY